LASTVREADKSKEQAENQAYSVNKGASGSVPLTFTVNEATSWMGYSLDNQANVTITGNTTLTGLASEPHNVIVYANDTYGNMGSSDKVYFTRIVNDVAVLNVTVSPTETYVNQIVNINVTVKNKETVPETFNVTAYYDSNIIDTQSVVNLAPSSNITITFSWNTSGVQKGIYTISAEAEVVPGETNTTDNTYINDTVTILNSPPTIDSFTPINTTPEVNEGDSLEFTHTSSDPDGDSLTVTWWLNQTDTGETSDSYTYTSDYESAGTYNATVVVSDGLSQTSHQWTLTVTNVERDIATTNVILSKSIVGQGYSMNITVTVENQGDFPETFNVTVFYDKTAITLPNGKNHTTTTLTSGNSTTLTLTWNTADIAKDNYIITAYSEPVPDEAYTADNTFTDGFVIVSCLGDLNGDYIVDGQDYQLVKNAVPSIPSSPNWNPNADLNDDGIVDGQDFQTVKSLIGTTAP
jgi:hypothetical protein